MSYSIDQSILILERTPFVTDSLLRNLPDEWIKRNEGGDSWTVYDIIGHLIHGEQTDWIARLEIILSDKKDKKFTPFDRFAQFHESKGKSLNDLLDEFKLLRAENLKILVSKNLSEIDLDRLGIHPDFGTVTLKNLIATWVVHDLNHLAQISRVMSFQYSEEVGPWKNFLRILKSQNK